jgi:hypothetical protein
MDSHLRHRGSHTRPNSRSSSRVSLPHRPLIFPVPSVHTAHPPLDEGNIDEDWEVAEGGEYHQLLQFNVLGSQPIRLYQTV